jgi:para-aminobenzoate synthetase component 1
MSFKDVDKLAKDGIPFLFISDFMAKEIQVIPLDELKNKDIKYQINEKLPSVKHHHFLKKTPIKFKQYKKKFDFVQNQIRLGNTYLLNLTQPTDITTKLNLDDIYGVVNAHYKLKYKNEFVCFSPERFIKIQNNKIHTYPMKGTIDSSIDNASMKILEDEKEMAEHIMVVDLLRNDLSIKAKNVRVEQFRYITEIEAGDKKLLQVSSHISGDLSDDWKNKLGSILKSLLPAGSISGTPKKSTLEIIQNIEGYERGFFSGVFGVFDGKCFDSAVMIRFIQKTDDGFLYKSGGGITVDSDPFLEYNEMIDKIYLP